MKYAPKTLAKEILEEIDNSEIIISKRDKNKEFMTKYNISTQDAKEYINSLTSENFEGKIENEDKRIPAEYLYAFTINTVLNDEFGNDLVNIYIKICKIDNNRIYVVSIHESEYLNY